MFQNIVHTGEEWQLVLGFKQTITNNKERQGEGVDFV